MEQHRTLTRSRLLAVLKIWKEDPLVWLPLDELEARIRRLQRKGE